jgi:hypothetical protein
VKSPAAATAPGPSPAADPSGVAGPDREIRLDEPAGERSEAPADWEDLMSDPDLDT